MSISDRTISSRKSRSRNDLSVHSSALSSSMASSTSSISDNVRKMQDSLQLLFSERDRVSIVQILEDFHRDRDVSLFVENLRPYIDSPIKVNHFLPCLRRVFPRVEVPTLDQKLREMGFISAPESERSESRTSVASTPLPDDAPSSFDSSTLTRSGFEPLPSSSSPHYSWVDRHGRPVSPPSQPTLGYRAGPDLLSLSLHIPPGRSLGLSIRGGSEFGLGIFVAGVDRHSVAESSGIMVGDQLLRVNDNDLELLRHSDAVRLLHRAGPHLHVQLRRVGRIPFAKKAADSGTQSRSSTLSSKRRAKSAGRQSTRASSPFDQFQLFSSRSDHPPGLLGRLTGPERRTLAYYMEEYRSEHIGVDDLVLAMSQLTEKRGRADFEELGKVLKGWIRPCDTDRYSLLTSLHEELSALRKERDRRGGDEDTRTVREENHVTNLTSSRSKSVGGESSCSDASCTSPLTSPGPPGAEKATSSCSDTVFAPPFQVSVDDVGKDSVDPYLKSPAPAKRHTLNATPARSASAATEVRLSRAIRDIEETGLSDDSGHGSAGLLKPAKRNAPPRLQDAGVCTEPRQSRDAGTLTDDELYPVRDRERVLVDRSVSASLGMSVEGGAGSKQPLPRIINVQLPADGKLVIATPSGKPTAVIESPLTCRVTVETVGGPAKLQRLGLAVQGGADVEAIPFPEIVRVEPGGAADATGRLRVGQTILEVNGVSLHGVQHHEAAQMIARAFRNPEVPTMELVVMEPSGDRS